MKLRSFTASDMPSAMKQIRSALGPDAVILSSQQEPGRNTIRVTAAIDADSGHATFEDFRETIELAKRRNQQREWLQQLTKLLEFHRLPTQVIRRLKHLTEQTDINALLMLHKLTHESSKLIVEEKTLATVLKHCFSFSPIQLEETGKRIGFIGPVGAGKTVATAKFATQLTMQNKPVSVITLDNERAGGIDQLSAYTNILNIPLHVAQNKQELMRIIKSIPLSHTTFIDTPGCNPMDIESIDQLLNMLDTSNIEPVLVLPAGWDSEESMDIAAAFNHPNIKRLLVTRMDTTRRFGNILAAASETGLAFSHFSSSPQVVDSCMILEENGLAKFLLQHSKKSAVHSQQKEKHHEHS